MFLFFLTTLLTLLNSLTSSDLTTDPIKLPKYRKIDPIDTFNWEEALKNITEIKNKWTSKNLANYVYGEKVSCFCTPCTTAHKFITVTKNQVSKVEFPSTSYCNSSDILPLTQYRTINDLFKKAIDYARSGLNANCSDTNSFNIICGGRIVFEFDDTFFYPTKVGLISGPFVADASVTIHVTCLTPLASTGVLPAIPVNYRKTCIKNPTTTTTRTVATRTTQDCSTVLCKKCAADELSIPVSSQCCPKCVKPTCKTCPNGWTDGCNTCSCLKDSNSLRKSKDSFSIIPRSICTLRACRIDELKPIKCLQDCSIVSCAPIKCAIDEEEYIPYGECCKQCRKIPINCDTCRSGYYFDGCNYCQCLKTGGVACTRKYCFAPGKPFCQPDCSLQLCYKPVCKPGQVLNVPKGSCCPICTKPSCESCDIGYFNGCNSCTCRNGIEIGCTKKYCPALADLAKNAKCLNKTNTPKITTTTTKPKTTPTTTESKVCQKTGCHGTVCALDPITVRCKEPTCLEKCYKFAKCLTKKVYCVTSPCPPQCEFDFSDEEYKKCVNDCPNTKVTSTTTMDTTTTRIIFTTLPSGVNKVFNVLLVTISVFISIIFI